MDFWSSILLSISLLCFSVERVNGQTTQTVQVGLEGSFFDPSYVVAQVGDIISFVFSGDMHSVTQSTFDNPCLPLAGGFNSGLAGKGTNASAPVPVWNLQITNTSDAIWYFCEAVVPKSHCNAGMVGVINPPNITAFTEFQSAAEAATGTPSPTPGVVLTGSGAFATASPSQVSTAPPTPSSTPHSSTSSAPGTTTIIVAPTNTGGPPTNVGAIVGGTVGGVLGFLLILVALFWVLQQRKSKRRSASLSHDDLPYLAKQPHFVTVRESDRDISSMSQREMGQAISRDRTLSPVRRPSPSQTHTLLSQTHTLVPSPTRPHFAVDHQSSFDSAAFAQARRVSEAQSNETSGINIQSLAHEVAAVLLQTPGLGGAGGAGAGAGGGGGQRQYANSGVGSNPDESSSGSRPRDGGRPEFYVRNGEDREQGGHPSPPHYRATVSPAGERLLPKEP